MPVRGSDLPRPEHQDQERQPHENDVPTFHDKP